jgi:hypothetical protein
MTNFKGCLKSYLPGTEMLESPSADSILHSSHSNKLGPDVDIRVRQNLKIKIVAWLRNCYLPKFQSKIRSFQKGKLFTSVT